MCRSESSYSHDKSFLFSLASVDILLAIAAMLSNLSLLVTLNRDPHKNLWTPTTLLIVNLSVCDIASGLLPGVGSAIYNLASVEGFMKSPTTDILSKGVVSISVITTIVGSCTIVAMSLNRLFAVSSPFQFRTSVSRRKIKVFVTVIWMYAFLFVSLSAVGVPISIFILLYCHIHITLPVAFLAVSYVQTYRALRSQNSHIQDLVNSNERMSRAHRSRERRIRSASLIVFVIFYSMFFPSYISLHILRFLPHCARTKAFLIFNSLARRLMLLNSGINPFIWAWRIPKFRQAFGSVFGMCFSRCKPKSARIFPLEALNEHKDVNAFVEGVSTEPKC